MNLLTSYDWLKEYVALKETPEEFAAKLSLSGPGVERLHPQGLGWDKIVLGQVLEIQPHPNADKLKLASVDVGARKISVVCGGSNLKEKQWVAVALLGAMVRWHGEGEPVELKPAEIRGVRSEGMICAANELGLYDAFPHAEREILDLGAALPGLKMKPGTPLADVLGLSGDTVMDIEVTSNRPDCMGLVGLAREAAAILKKPFIWKAVTEIQNMRVLDTRVTPEGKALSARSEGEHGRGPAGGRTRVQVVDKKLCPRYMAVRLDGVKVGPSPWWLKRRLLSAGVRPINNLVDITNYVMLELGQPMHVFDAGKLSGNQIVVRAAKAGETMSALDGQEYELDSSMLVIADAVKPVAVAGVMGGEATGVTTDTTSVVFEAATFDPVSVRRTARKLNLYSDSQLRFEKGLSVQAPPLAMARAVELCQEMAGGQVVSVADVMVKKYAPLNFSLKIEDFSKLIGVKIANTEIVRILKSLGFGVNITGGKLTATVPWWRDHDIESGRDLVEEVARLYGYGRLPPVFPVGLSGRPVAPELSWEKRVRTLAKGAGLTEIFSYSFVSRDLLEKAGYEPDPMLRVSNPLSADFEFMRTTLLPSLLQVVAENQERFRQQSIFEIAHVYYPTAAGWQDLPDEQLELGAAFLGGQEVWRQAKGFVQMLFSELGVVNHEVKWKRLEGDAFWHPGRSAQAFVGDELVATLGELNPRLSANFKFENRIALVDLPLETVFKYASAAKHYVPLPAFPEAKRDLAIIVDLDATVQKMIEIMAKAQPIKCDIEWFDTYRGKGLSENKKSVAFHLTFYSTERTLETKEVDSAMEQIIAAVKKHFKAEVRS